MEADTSKARGIAAPEAAGIAEILRLVRKAEVVASIVESISVAMIDPDVIWRIQNLPMEIEHHSTCDRSSRISDVSDLRSAVVMPCPLIQ